MFVFSFIDGCMSCFYLLVTVNNATLWTSMYKDLSPTFNYFGYIPRGGIPESYRMMFNILRNDIKFYDIFYVAQYFILFFLIIF